MTNLPRGRSLALSLLSLLALLLAILPLVPASTLRAAASATPAGPLDVDRFDAFVRDRVQRHGIPGLALGLVEGDQIVHLRGFGRADQTGRAVMPQTPFIVASVSKPLTALAVMQLVDAGDVHLDTPVQRYLPSFRVADPAASARITVRHLLNHTSGLPEWGCRSRAGAETLEQFVAELRTVDLDAPPGARHAYCSGNYNVLGRLVEVISGQAFGDYMARHVFAPLRMRHSFAAEQPARRDGLAQRYQWIFGVSVPTEFRFDPAHVPAGFLVSSAEDLSHFLIAQLNGGRFDAASVLSPEGVAAMQAPGVPIGPGRGEYGLGWKTASPGGVPSVYHDGAHPNTRTYLFMRPDARRGAVLLVNAHSMLAEATVFAELSAGVARLLDGQEPAPASSPRLRTLYILADALLAALLALALWPLLRLQSWAGALRRRHRAGRLVLLPVVLRLVWELVFPLVLLGLAALFAYALGARSFAEAWSLFPDLGAWLAAVSLVVLLTGSLRLALTARALRRGAPSS